MKRAGLLAAALAVGGLSCPVQAETLTVTGLYPAGSSEANEVRSIAVEPFVGRDGPSVSDAIERELEAVVVEGQPYFDVISYRSSRDPDALVTGTGLAEVERYTKRESRRRCVERDADDKCTKRKMIKVFCSARDIDVTVSVRLAGMEGGRNRFTRDYDRKNEQVDCGKNERITGEESEIRRMAQEIAVDVRNDLAPRELRQEIRVLESRKGMTGAEGQAFKKAVRMTKRDELQACTMWRDMAEAGTSHISLLFNLGLCAEKSGELMIALQTYRDAESRFGRKSEVDQAKARVNDRLRANEEWRLRQQALVSN